MSSASIDTLSNGYAALAARDEQRLMDCLTEDVELHTLTGTYRGHDGMRKWIAEMDEGWDPWELTIGDVTEMGDRVLLEVRLDGRSVLNDIAMSQSFWAVWQLRGGRAAIGIHCADREQAMHAIADTQRLESSRP